MNGREVKNLSKQEKIAEQFRRLVNTNFADGAVKIKVTYGNFFSNTDTNLLIVNK